VEEVVESMTAVAALMASLFPRIVAELCIEAEIVAVLVGHCWFRPEMMALNWQIPPNPLGQMDTFPQCRVAGRVSLKNILKM
jgi:hypothetical protein